MLSRTLKTRPEWVKLNDPNFPTIERHDHLVTKKEPTGRMVKRSRLRWVGGEWPYTEEEIYEVPEIRTWTEVVPCDIDTPHKSWRERRKDWQNGTEKRCEKRPLVRTPCSCCSRWYAKRLSAKAQRASINQQLHNAVRDYGHNCDTDPYSEFEAWEVDGERYYKNAPNWWDIDIHPGASEDWKFWD